MCKRDSLDVCIFINYTVCIFNQHVFKMLKIISFKMMYFC